MAKQDPNNYRKHSDRNKELIKKSLAKLGAGRSVLIDSEDYLIAGNGVMEQAEALGIPTRVIETDGTELVVVKRTDLTLNDPKRKELALADNATSDTSKWDVEALVGEWGEDELNEWDVNIEWPEEAEPSEDPGPPEVKEEAETVLGDLYELNGHRVLCDSSTDSDAVAKLFDGDLPEAVFTDPPYGVAIVSKSSGKVGGGLIVDAKEYDEIIGDETTETARDFYGTCMALGLENYFIWGGNYFTDFLPPSPCWIIWDKENNGNFADVEMAWTSKPNSAKLYKWLWNGLCRKGDRSTELVSRVHPTQKPVGLFVDIFKDFDFASCYDGFLGSGTTLIAAEQTGRICYGTELAPNYCDVIVKRWVNYMRANDKAFTVKRNGEDITNAEWLQPQDDAN